MFARACDGICADAFGALSMTSLCLRFNIVGTKEAAVFCSAAHKITLCFFRARFVGGPRVHTATAK